jgi:hypothetical protein
MGFINVRQPIVDNQLDLGPGDFASIPPGHDAWVVGNEPFVCVDFSPDMKQYAEKSGEAHC